MDLFSTNSFLPSEFLAFKANFSKWIEKSGYEVIIEHGQRIFRPKETNLFANHHIFEDLFNHEVYIRNLPPDFMEPELLAYLKPVGRIYQIRLMLTFSGQSNGSAYVIFENVSDAFNCIKYLSGKYLIPAQLEPLEVDLSANNNRLLLKNLPTGISNQQIVNILKENNIEGVKEVKLRSVNDSNATNAIVVFYNHRFASIARRSLVPGLIEFGGHVVRCDWYKPKDTKTLFLRFNRSSINRSIIEQYFQRFNTQIMNIEIQNNYVFIRFSSCHEADRILKLFQAQPGLLSWGNGLKLDKIDWPIRKGYLARGST